jgi:hypothetical protein
MNVCFINCVGRLSFKNFLILTRCYVVHLLLLADAKDYEPSGGQSVSLPSHKPLLTLRDPPGGGSHSYYQNVKTTMKLTLENYESYVDIAACKCEKI